MPLYIRVAIHIVSAAALFSGLFLAFLGLIFFNNFNFAKGAHLGIFVATFFAPLSVAASWLLFKASPSHLSIALTLASYAITVLAWLLWGIPAARGLIH